MRLNWGTAPIGAFELFEISLVLLAVAVAFLRPALGSALFRRVEESIASISRRPWICAAILFLSPILVRVLLLPVYGVPAPYISDEYAYLLQADTFASGRLTNPPPPSPERFTSVYVLTEPSYTAEYQPAQGALLAFGQKLTGIPWIAVMLSMGILCLATYWALLAWLPKTWAFIGTAVVIDVQLGVLSYWMNSYWGGCVPAIGGALALGALPRILGRHPARYSFVAAAGLLTLFNSRPLEGVFLTFVVAVTLLYWTFLSKQLSLSALLSRVLPALAISSLAAVAFAGYYNSRVTGKATQFPYLEYRNRYGLPQGFFWQKPVLADTSDMPVDIRAEYEDQLRQHERRTSPKALIGATGGKLRRFWEFYIGIPLTLTLLFVPFIWRGPNMGVAFWTLMAVLVLDNLLFFAYFPHYSAAVTVLIALVLIQCLRRMRGSGTVGLFLSRALPAICLLGLIVPVAGRLTQGALPAGLSKISKLWNSEFVHDVSREAFVPRLEREPGRHLVFVRYRPYDGGKKNEWIFNRADLANARIIWARDSADPASNGQFLQNFAGRTVWLAEPDAKPARITPYLSSR